MKIDEIVKRNTDETANYIAKMINGWIIGDATTPIQDKDFDNIRIWINEHKKSDEKKLWELEGALLRIRKYTTSKTIHDFINEVIEPDERALEYSGNDSNKNSE